LIVRASNDGIAIAPPLIVSKEQCDTIVGVITEAVKEILG
jgi:adenosylmethionine-8-amino-7-oxononanoate aminotransferase